MNGGDTAAAQEPRIVKVNYFLNEIRDRCNNLDVRLLDMLERARGQTPEVASAKQPGTEAPSQGMMYQVEYNVEEINVKLTTLQARVAELESII